jgi:membrane dipeptidase
LFRLYLKNKKNVHEDFLLGDNEGHLDLPRMNKAGFSGGFLQYMFLPKRKKLNLLINQ